MQLGRRTLLTGAAAAGTAQAAATYDIAVYERYRNQIRIHAVGHH